MWYEFDPPQLQFAFPGGRVPNHLKADPADPEVGVLYLNEENLARGRDGCETWRQRERSSSPSSANAENEMDEATAAALGEV